MNSNDGSHPNWEQFCLRVSSNVRLSDGKKSKLLEENFAEKEVSFIKRNMVDTQYMARAISAWLSDSLNFSTEFDQKQHVYAVNGRMTAKLRRKWGLNFGEDDTKDRSDNRHHAIDAAVIAVCSASMVKEFAISCSRLRDVRDSVIAEPWEGFADQVREAREWIIPTMYRPNKKNGLLFEESRYRYVGKKKKHILTSRDGKEKSSGNIRFFENEKDGKHVKIVGNIAYIRLWLDESARKGKGEWLIEPLYFADLQSIKDGSYVPRYISASHVTSDEWKSIPKDVLSKIPPVVVHIQDVIQVDSSYFRVDGVDIDSKALNLIPVFRDSNNSNPALAKMSKWNKGTEVTRISEDALGLVWFNFLKNQNSSES